jgi:hypothetical protein
MVVEGHGKGRAGTGAGLRRRLLQVAGPVLIALVASACVPSASGDAPPGETAPVDALKKPVATTPTTVAPVTTPTTTAPVATTPTTAAPVPTTTPPPTAPLPGFGTQFHATWSDYTDSQRALALDRLKAAGATWVRIDVGWRTLEPSAPGGIASWYLRLIQYSVDQARARGINVILTVLDTPAWASGSTDPSVPPRNPADYGRLVGWLASQLRGRVAAYEIWNEPDATGFWKGTPAQYVGLLKAAYPTVKAGDPATKVVAGATVYNNDAFLNAVYAAGGRGYFDVWSTHPYMGKADAPPETPDDGNVWILDHVRAVRNLMVAKGDGNKPIWFTEFGWSSHTTASGAPSWKLGVTATQQADYLVRAMRFVAANHPYVQTMIWYNERNKATGDIHEDNYGLMTRDFQPKPVYSAIQSLLA